MVKHWWPVHDEDEIGAVLAVLRAGRTNYWTGDQGRTFEQEWAAYVGAPYALTCSSGTTALELALGALDLCGGDVIVPARTFVACASAVITAGGWPVLADIDRETLCVNWSTIRAALTPRVRAVMVVHYAGLPIPVMEMAEIRRQCNAHGIALIEDCAHAHTNEVAQWGDISCWSMCVGKVMSTGGEGGMVVTHNDRLFRRMTARRDHGRYQMIGSREAADLTTFRYTVETWGTNARMTEMQAVIGRFQLRKLPAWISRRREIMRRYDHALGQRVYIDHLGHGGYMYLLRVDPGARERVLAKVPHARWGGCANIGHEPAFRGEARACPVADAVGREIVSLPVYPTMTDEEVDDICRAVKREL